jgi:DNA-directed RNA polymerase specialized sigma24 family protein
VDDEATIVASPAIAAVERSAPLVAELSFEEVVQFYRLPMLRLARFLLGPHGSAEDVVHDALLKTYLRLDRIDNPSAYLRRCVTNACHSEHRRRAVFQRIAPRLVARTAQTEPADYLLDGSSPALSPTRRGRAAELRGPLHRRHRDDAALQHQGRRIARTEWCPIAAASPGPETGRAR